MALEGPL